MGQVLAAVGSAASSPVGQAILSDPGSPVQTPQLAPASSLLPNYSGGSTVGPMDSGLPGNGLPPLSNNTTPNLDFLLKSQDTNPKNPYSTDIPATLKQAAQPNHMSFLDQMGNALLAAHGINPMLHSPQPTISTQADVNVPTTSLVPGASANAAPAGQQSNKKGL